MGASIIVFAISVGAVTLAEMGDKTQLLAMAFATKYKAYKVLIGVFIATVLNHAFAVAVGNLVTKNPTLDVWIQVLASLSFIFFGLWTIRGDKLDGEQNKKTRFGAIMTVAIAFFIAELGDKTQLTTIALAAKYPENPVLVLMGTTTGMIIADAIGIIVGVVLCMKIPEKTIKLVSAGAFIVFGLINSFNVADNKLKLDHGIIFATLSVITIITLFIGWFLYKKNKDQNLTTPEVDEFCAIRNPETLE